MDLAEILIPETILIHWKPASKDDAIMQLIDAMADAGVIQDREQVVDDVLERERSLSTGLGEGIAYPHARSKGVDRVAMAFGIVPDGLDFESRDDTPAVFIPLMVSPEDSGSPHLYVMAEIVQKLGSREIRDQLLQAENTEQVCKILTS